MEPKSNTRNPVILVVLAAAVLAAASIVLLLRQYRIEVDNAQVQLLAKGHTTLDALTAGIRAQSRRGMYRSERLTAIFDELAQTPGILALQLRSSSGALVAAGGELVNVPDLPPGTELWRPDTLIMTASAEFTHDGPGMGPWDGAAARAVSDWDRGAAADAASGEATGRTIPTRAIRRGKRDRTS